MAESEIETETRERPRGIYLIPNLFTTAALFAGFYGIVASINADFTPAAIALVIAGVLDGLDGRIARLTKTQSDFGVQYDSMSDLVSFGLAPSMLVYNYSLASMGEFGNGLGKLGWLAAFMYAACAALRLARFNTQAGVADKRYFQGIASPAAAGLLTSVVWALHDNGFDGSDVYWLIAPLTVIAALLMVSNVRYFSFKAWPGDRVSFLWIFLIVVIFALLALDPPLVLAAIGVTYAASGPIMTIMGRDRRQRARARRREQAE